MILGTEARVRPLIDLVERHTDIDLTRRRAWPMPDQRDRGNFLSARLYPSAAFDPWQPALSYVTSPVADEASYAAASESM